MTDAYLCTLDWPRPGLPRITIVSYDDTSTLAVAKLLYQRPTGMVLDHPLAELLEEVSSFDGIVQATWSATQQIFCTEAEVVEWLSEQFHEHYGGCWAHPVIGECLYEVFGDQLNSVLHIMMVEAGLEDEEDGHYGMYL